MAHAVSLPRTWQDATAVSATGEITLVAADGTARGPLVFYASSATVPNPQPIDWPPTAVRGFSSGRYDRFDKTSEAKLEQDLADDQMRPDEPAAMARFVERLELWRTPDAPARLAADLGSTAPVSVVARLTPASDNQRLFVCPRFAYRDRTAHRRAVTLRTGRDSTWVLGR